jgi:photosystem II stability/assembly factor-like uncharacterized protein
VPSWEIVWSIAVHPTRPNTVWVGTRHEGILRSTDGGQTWTRSADIPIQFDVRALLVDPGNPRVLYAGIEGGAVFKSTDGGQTWAMRNTGLGSETWVYALAIDRTITPAILYLGGFDPNGHGAVYRSADGASSWSRITDATMTTTWVASLALTPGGTKLYAGTISYGVETGGGAFASRVR